MQNFDVYSASGTFLMTVFYPIGLSTHAVRLLLINERHFDHGIAVVNQNERTAYRVYELQQIPA